MPDIQKNPQLSSKNAQSNPQASGNETQQNKHVRFSIDNNLLEKYGEPKPDLGYFLGERQNAADTNSEESLPGGGG